MKDTFLFTPLKKLQKQWPWIEDFFAAHEIDISRQQAFSFMDLSSSLTDSSFADIGTTREQFIRDFQLFVEQMHTLKDGSLNGNTIQSITIQPGMDKEGNTEPCSIELTPGSVTAIVGPTGSGKSRLLEDIECLAQKDTPTKRNILVNGTPPSDELRFSTEERLIAQLSQNMNFVMDLSVEDFLTIHAESRMVENISKIVHTIFTCANGLAGEQFSIQTPVTQLSGGQSRALMIADTALLSAAPIILIDEIENAGVDKITALDLLVTNNKIVLISTHDPLLALSAQQRIIIKKGGIQKIITTSQAEKAYLVDLKKMDDTIHSLRGKLRAGETLLSNN